MTFIVQGPGLHYNVTPESLLKTTGTPIIPAIDPSKRVTDKEHEGKTDHYTPSHQQHAAQQAYQQTAQPEGKNEPATLAEQIMSSPVISLPSHLSVQTGTELLAKHQIRHLLITDSDNQLIGIVSERDIWHHKLESTENESNNPISTLMSEQVLSATMDTEIRELAKVMSTRRIGALPIISNNLQPIGIVTRSDILQALVDHASLQLWA